MFLRRLPPWLLGSQRPLAVVLALAAAVLLVAAGSGCGAPAEWWRTAAVVGLTAQVGLMDLYPHPWFLFIQAVNAALIVGIVWLLMASVSLRSVPRMIFRGARDRRAGEPPPEPGHSEVT